MPASSRLICSNLDSPIQSRPSCWHSGSVTILSRSVKSGVDVRLLNADMIKRTDSHVAKGCLTHFFSRQVGWKKPVPGLHGLRFSSDSRYVTLCVFCVCMSVFV